MTPGATPLFVYGTLRRGFDNRFARMLAQSARYLGAGHVNGLLYRLGDYPGLVLSTEPGNQVRGDVYELNDPDATLRMLDDYEGPEYPRVHVTVSIVESSETLKAWAYICEQDVSGKPRIESGDFLA